ncbi:superinfection immunity protein [Paraburkholderia youngii]|uniref:superinfection immunity protein n=1 Tax=Paraburkholderia youngii TaxID=2782701 RepID=UPI003D251793
MYTSSSIPLSAIVIIALYLLPAIVAACRKHRNSTAIAVLNVFTGWTALGWIASLVWACTCNTKPNA